MPTNPIGNALSSGPLSAVVNAAPSTGVSAPSPGPSDPSSLLPEPVAQLFASGDVGAELAAYCVLSGEQQQQAARAERDAVELSQERDEDAEVQAMRDKAGAVLDGAIAQGLGTIAQGAAQLGDAAAAANDGTAANGQIQQGSGRWLSLNEGQWKCAGVIAGGAGQISAGIYQASGAHDDADAAEAHAGARRFGGVAQDAQQTAQSAQGFVETAIGFYREYVTTQAQTRNAALHVA